MSLLNNLIVRIRGDKTQLDQTLKGAEKSVSNFGGAVKKIGPQLAALFSVTAIVAFGKQVINASEALSDKFTAAMEGAKGAAFEFFNKIATGDFKNFVSDIKEAFIAAKGLAEQFDRLKDIGAYTEYITSTQRAESTELQETLKNTSLKISVRKEAAEKILKIEKEILDKTQSFASMQFNLEKQSWENRNKMAADKAKEMYETIIGLDEKTINKLNSAFENQISLFGGKKGIEQVRSGKAQRGQLTGISEDTIKLYADYLDLLRESEEDVIPNLFKLYTEFNKANISAQERYNGLLRYTTGLLKEQGTTVAKITPVTGPSAIGTSNIKMPGFGAKLEGLSGRPTWIEDSTAAMEKQIEVAEELEESLYNLFTNAKFGWKSMLDSMLTELTHYIAKAMAKYIALGIIKALAGELPVANISNLSIPKLSGNLPGLQGAPKTVLNASGPIEFKIHGKDLQTILQRNQ